MQILKTKLFEHWVKEVELEDLALSEAIREIEEGLFDANLGGNVYKKRISIRNQGKRGARTIVAFKMNERAVFIYGYAKNKRSSITKKEEKALKELANCYFAYSEAQIDRAIKMGELIEVRS